MVDAVEICKKVLARLSAMDFEKAGGSSSEQLIFPQKVQAKGTKLKDRISEQELRLLFIEEFKKANQDLFYSIETPTVDKFKVGKEYKSIKTDNEGQSASLDMCVFERNSNKYERLLNIEFKHKNASIKKIGKDVLKLMQEKQNGVFIYLLENTNSGTLRNVSKTREGVFDKLYKSFTDFKSNWNNENKSIQLIILSLKQEMLIHRRIFKTDLDNLKEIFFIDKACGNMTEKKGKEWKVEHKINSNE